MMDSCRATCLEACCSGATQALLFWPSQLNAPVPGEVVPDMLWWTLCWTVMQAVQGRTSRKQAELRHKLGLCHCHGQLHLHVHPCQRVSCTHVSDSRSYAGLTQLPVACGHYHSRK